MQRGTAATEAMESSYTPGPDDHAGRRAAMALTRCQWCAEEDKLLPRRLDTLHGPLTPALSHPMGEGAPACRPAGGGRVRVTV
jgi:hypothetical protein